MKSYWIFLVFPVIYTYNPPELPDCGSDQWTTFKDSCYYAENPSSSPKDWYSAEEFCNTQGGHLISVHGKEEDQFIFEQMDLKGVITLWTGMNILGGVDSGFEWTDGSPVDFTRLGDVDLDKGRCMAVQQLNRKWILSHCSEPKGLVCKRSPGGSIRSFQTTLPIPGNCEDGWTRIGNKCFGLFGSNLVERQNWLLAKDTCRIKGRNAALASVHSLYEQAVLTTWLTSSLPGVWIGLNAIAVNNESIFSWIDNSRVDFAYWAPGKPVSKEEKCVEISTSEHMIGKWNEVACTQKRSFVCQKEPDESVVTEKPIIEQECSSEGFAGFNKACYRAVSQPVSNWNDAETNCNKLGGHLASILDPIEQAYLHILVQKTNASTELWIGLSDWTEGRFLWSDGCHVQFTNWAKDEPGNHENGRCVALNSEAKDWIVQDCRAQKGYICKIGAVAPVEISSAVPPGGCPDHVKDWIDVGLDHCYFVQNDGDSGLVLSTWPEAQFKCSQNGSVLASFHSQEELNRLQHIIQRGKYDLWIGLIKKYHGGFEWSDLSAVDFENWEDGFPSNASLDNVVMLSIGNMAWKNVERSLRKGHLCMIDKDLHSLIVQGHKEGMRGDAIAVIVVGGFLAFMIVLVSVLILVKVRRTSPGGVFPCEKRARSTATSHLIVN